MQPRGVKERLVDRDNGEFHSLRTAGFPRGLGDEWFASLHHIQLVVIKVEPGVKSVCRTRTFDRRADRHCHARAGYTQAPRTVTSLSQ